MEELTCPNCNVDVEKDELRRNNGMCPTCGHDMSDAEEIKDDLAEEEDDEELKDKDEDEEDEEEEEEEDDEDEE